MEKTRNCSVYGTISSYAPDIKLRLHTPAHQGSAENNGYFRAELYRLDTPYLVPELLLDNERHVAGLYGTKHTFFLTGGTTQGALASCVALARRDSCVALGRNSHISFIHGLILTGLKPVFIPSRELLPTVDEVIEALGSAAGQAGAVVLGNPNYAGMKLEPGRLTEYCRERNIRLVVDEAHGTHFPFTEGSPKSALAEGADIVLHSLHKYLGSFVQTGLLHLPRDSSFSHAELRAALELFESTTRSNLLMLSIDEAVQKAFSPEGRRLFSLAARRAGALRETLRGFGDVLYCREFEHSDPLKLLLASSRASGAEIGALFLERKIDYEYVDRESALYIFSFRNAPGDFNLFSRALQEVYRSLARREPKKMDGDKTVSFNLPLMRLTPREAFFSPERREIALSEATGRINCSNYVKCPPGIPILIPGEEITGWHLENLPGDLKISVVG